MRRYVFADEAGCFNFSRAEGASKYFVLCTVSTDSHKFATPLLDLRRWLAWEKQIDAVFHASTDLQEVRNEVYSFIQKQDLRIDATILEKSKAEPKIRPTEERFYHYAWYYHFKHVAPLICSSSDELFITVASIGTKKKRELFKEILCDVASQAVSGATFRSAFWPAASDPCLQVADYCAWAIQRKWESDQQDLRSYDLIKDKLKTEFDLFASGTKHYY